MGTIGGEREKKEGFVRAFTRAEQKYTWEPSQQLRGQTGWMGAFSGGFDREEANVCGIREGMGGPEEREAFLCGYQEVLSSLREEGGPLHSRLGLETFIRSHPDSAFWGKARIEYGFRADYGKYAFLFRCDLRESGRFVCAGYLRERLDRHIRKAEAGIRFIDSKYRELFRIPDGGKIRITDAAGRREERVCRFIDETHAEIGEGWNHLYHICQFAEQMEKNGMVYEPASAGPPPVMGIKKHRERER